MNPHIELIKRTVLELLKAKLYEEAEKKFGELTAPITAVIERVELDQWFDKQVRLLIVPSLMEYKQYEKAKEIYEKQMQRDVVNPYEGFDKEWEELLNKKTTEEEARDKEIEREKLDAEIKKSDNFARALPFIIAIGMFVLGIIIKIFDEQNGRLFLVAGFLMIIVCFYLYLRSSSKDAIDSLKEKDPIREEYERRKRTGENR